jgi:putative toxin-antitoxin system antitoxin component (TIGR02293 family)
MSGFQPATNTSLAAAFYARNSGSQPDVSRGLVACVVPRRLQACRTGQAKSLSYSGRQAALVELHLIDIVHLSHYDVSIEATGARHMKTAIVEKKIVQPKKSHPHGIIRRIQKGFPFRELQMLQNTIDMPLEQLAAKLLISRSTLQRRKTAGRLSPDESDKVVRFSRLLTQATELFGTIDKARAWLKHPQRGLGGAIPLDYAETELGAREVEKLLGRISYGVYS